MDLRYQAVGLVGAPVAENPAGATVEAAFLDLGLRWRYRPMDVAPPDLLASAAPSQSPTLLRP
jgi:shikimate 5-dehydrogenase